LELGGVPNFLGSKLQTQNWKHQTEVSEEQAKRLRSANKAFTQYNGGV
jgi:hypothetical protein